MQREKTKTKPKERKELKKKTTMWQEGSGSVGESTNQIIGNAWRCIVLRASFQVLAIQLLSKKKIIQ